MTIKDKFLYDFEMSTKSHIIVIIKRPEGGEEIIINTQNLDEKIKYYAEAYDDDLKLVKNPEVQILNYLCN